MEFRTLQTDFFFLGTASNLPVIKVLKAIRHNF